MGFVVTFAFVILTAFAIRAEVKENALSEEGFTKSGIAETEGKCSFECALKTLMFDDNQIGIDFLKLLSKYDDESDVDTAIETCNQTAGNSDVSCEKYFDCIEEEFKNNNVTFLFFDAFFR